MSRFRAGIESFNRVDFFTRELRWRHTRAAWSIFQKAADSSPSLARQTRLEPVMIPCGAKSNRDQARL